MKTKIISFLFSLTFLISFSQKIDDLNNQFSISVITYPDYLRDLPRSTQTTRIESKLLRMVSNYGISGLDHSDRFIIYPIYTLNDYSEIETTVRNIHSVKAELTIIVKEKKTDKIFGSYTQRLRGEDYSKEKAINKSIQKIKTKNTEVETFLSEVKAKIITYYKVNCNTILDKATLLISTNKFEEAIKSLSTIPSQLVTENCFTDITSKLREANLGYINSNCADIIKHAEKIMSEGKENYYANALLAGINKKSKCYPTALKMMTKNSKPLHTKQFLQENSTRDAQKKTSPKIDYTNMRNKVIANNIRKQQPPALEEYNYERAISYTMLLTPITL